MYRDNWRIISYSQICVRKDHAHFASSMAWMKMDYIPKEGKQTRACLYPTCIRGSPEQTCPGGNHLSESKWCNIMNTWSRKNPARAILARTAMMWRQTMIVQTHLPVQWLSCKTWQAGRWQQWVAPGNSKLPAYLQTVVHCVSFQ